VTNLTEDIIHKLLFTLFSKISILHFNLSCLNLSISSQFDEEEEEEEESESTSILYQYKCIHLNKTTINKKSNKQTKIT